MAKSGDFNYLHYFHIVAFHSKLLVKLEDSNQLQFYFLTENSNSDIKIDQNFVFHFEVYPVMKTWVDIKYFLDCKWLMIK